MQDIYSEPKILKKSRKRNIDQVEKDSTSVKSLIDKITHNRIKDLEFNVNNKVLNKHLNLHEPSINQKLKNQNQFKTQAKKISKSEARQKDYLELEQLIRVEQKSYRYEDFLQLNSLWTGYMHELLEISPIPKQGGSVEASNVTLSRIISNPSIVQSKLTKADFHGAFLSVNKSKNPTLVGQTGIVFQETEQAFKIINSEDQIKLLPKNHSIFEISITIEQDEMMITDRFSNYSLVQKKTLKFRIIGNCFRFRSNDRVNKKFKFKSNFEL
ncbi:Rof/RNase P-like protein [Phakopsora pachyrhizi]|uniref:Ribonuclease P protein subunit n=1 Tax=Phakopsora pachyrhizi TaxID=170000 RepID=A0AAV0BJV7_PHAPC|nr:Rof/RNase P-like protein [Phakopsora pachyrhizi]